MHSIHQCRTITAAIFDGNSSRAQHLPVYSMSESFESISNGTADIASFSLSTHNMERDIYEVRILFELLFVGITYEKE